MEEVDKTPKFIDKESIKVIAQKINSKLEVIQTDPSELVKKTDGKTYLYLGNSTENFKKWHSYEYHQSNDKWEDVTEKTIKTTEEVPENPQDKDVIVYTGTTTENFKKGHSYKFSSIDGWEDLTPFSESPVSSNSGLQAVEEVPENPKDKDLIMYVGETTNDFVKGHIYKYIEGEYFECWTLDSNLLMPGLNFLYHFWTKKGVEISQSNYLTEIFEQQKGSNILFPYINLNDTESIKPMDFLPACTFVSKTDSQIVFEYNDGKTSTEVTFNRRTQTGNFYCYKFINSQVFRNSGGAENNPDDYKYIYLKNPISVNNNIYYPACKDNDNDVNFDFYVNASNARFVSPLSDEESLKMQSCSDTEIVATYLYGDNPEITITALRDESLDLPSVDCDIKLPSYWIDLTPSTQNTESEKSLFVFNRRPFVEKPEDLDKIDGEFIWTDGTNIFCDRYNSSQYSNVDAHKVFNKATNGWDYHDWEIGDNNLSRDSIDKTYIWKYNSEVYFSYGSKQYVLRGNKWSPIVWESLTNFYGSNLWKDKDGDIFSGVKGTVYKLINNNWTLIKITGFPADKNFQKNYIWTDGINTYYDCYYYYSSSNNEDTHYKLNKINESTYAWEEYTPPIGSMNGSNVWTDDENNLYYSDGYKQYIFDKSLSVWKFYYWSTHNQYFKGNKVWINDKDIHIDYYESKRRGNDSNFTTTQFHMVSVCEKRKVYIEESN